MNIPDLRRVAVLLSLSISIACADAPPAAPSPPTLPPPLPPTAAVVPSVEPAPTAQPVAPEPAAPVGPRASTKQAPSKHAPAPATSPKGKTPKPSPESAPVTEEAPVPKPAKPVASTATKVMVPRTQHVHVDVPAGLQRWLDEDDRMLPWLSKVISVIDKCYADERAKNATVAGTISVGVVMHENARPDADIKSLPPALSGVVACATGGLMRARMPLFTGKEGESYKLDVHFSP